VEADAFLLVADSVWMHGHIQMRTRWSVPHTPSRAAPEQPAWSVARNRT